MYFAKILALVVVLAVAAHCAPTKQKNTKISCESNITRTNTFILVNRINKFSMFRHSEISAFSKDHFWIFELWAGLLSSNVEFIMTLKSKKSRTTYLKNQKNQEKSKKSETVIFRVIHSSLQIMLVLFHHGFNPSVIGDIMGQIIRGPLSK